MTNAEELIGYAPREEPGTTAEDQIGVSPSSYQSEPPPDWSALNEALRWALQRGASDKVLICRMSYGGRKGRRAAKRLVARYRAYYAAVSPVYDMFGLLERRAITPP